MYQFINVSALSLCLQVILISSFILKTNCHPLLQDVLVIDPQDTMVFDPSQYPIQNLNRRARNITLTFDDVTLPANTSTQPLHTHSFFDFHNFQIINTTAAVRNKDLSPLDSNCASSPPNALLPITNGPSSPAIMTANTTLLAQNNLSTYFNLNSLTLKPLGRISRPMSMVIRAWEIGDDGVAKNVWQLYMFPMVRGEHFPAIKFEFGRIANDKRWGKNVNWVEVTGQDRNGEGWAVSVDDIGIEIWEE